MEPKNSDPSAVYFIKCLIKRYIDDDVGSFASEASYCFILGLIPFMIFLVNCILFFAAPQLDTILDLLQYLPAQFAASMEENIARIIAGRSTIWLFAGLGAAVWTASQGTAVLVRGMDKIFFSGQKYPVLAQGQPESLLLYRISCICHDSFSYADCLCQCRHIPCTGLYHGPAVCLLAGLAAVAVCHSFCGYEPVFIRLLPLCAKQVHHEMDTHHSCFLSGGGGSPFPDCRVWLLYPPYIGHGRHLRFPYRPDLPLSLDPSGGPDYSCRRCGDHGMGRYASPAPVRIFPVARRKNYRHPK